MTDEWLTADEREVLARIPLAPRLQRAMPDRRPCTPPTPETPAERVQGEAGEVAE